MDLHIEQYPKKMRGSEIIALASGDMIQIRKRIGSEISVMVEHECIVPTQVTVGLLIEEEDNKD